MFFSPVINILPCAVGILRRLRQQRIEPQSFWSSSQKLFKISIRKTLVGSEKNVKFVHSRAATPRCESLHTHSPSMNTSPADKWNACLDVLKHSLPINEYETWFSALRFAGFEQNRLFVLVPAKYVAEYIGRHHRDSVKHALVQVFGEAVQLFWRYPEATPAASASPNASSEPQRPKLDPQLNPRYTFGTFVEGVSNRLPRTVALSIADTPGQDTFNPFFLYGPPGVGKTHLVNAIGARICEQYPEKRVLFVPAHTFKTQYTDSVRRNKLNDFMNFYQSIDVLIIDDIQGIATPKTLQTFFHIFNHLQQNRRQIIMTCDRPPVQLEGMEERMLSRFKWGMIAAIEKPDPSLRLAILKAKIKRDGLRFIPKEVVQYIAENVESSVRELEGLLNTLMMRTVCDNCDIDIEMAQRVIACVVDIDRRDLSPDDIISVVAQQTGVKPKEITSKLRKHDVAQARQLAMYLIHKHCHTSYAQIGRCFGGRDHSTVLYSCDQVSRRLSVDKDFRRMVDNIEMALKKMS